MIELSKVFVHYGAKPALRDISLRVEGGTLVGVMGPNGVGKTTLLKVIAGILHPLQGHVEIDGRRRRRSIEEEREIRKNVFYLPDHPWLPMHMNSLVYLNHLGRIYGVEEVRLMSHAEDLLELFDLTDRGDSPIRAYSNGQQKKLAVCGALVTEAPILILDEPFSGGLDPSALMSLKTVLKNLADDPKVTILLATQVPELIEPMADCILVLRDGRILAFDTLEALREKTGEAGDLQNVLENLINPKTSENIEKYFSRRKTR